MVKTEFLTIKNASILVSIFKDSKITIGVPHHTPGGTAQMPCSEHKYGDENAGYIGQYISEKIGASFVCACNYFLDANKSLNTDYSVAIIKSNPTYLIEVHGHDRRHTDNDIEISCGNRKREKYALKLKLQIESIIKEWSSVDPKWSLLKKIKIGAKFENIYFKATASATIQNINWIPLHIELSSILRKDAKTYKVTNEGILFQDILCEAIKRICK